MSDTPATDEHVVFFTTALGDPAAERHPSQQSAVSRVEFLCNEDDVQDATVYALVPVPLRKRSYWHVAVDAESLLGALSVPSPPAAPTTRVPDEGEAASAAVPKFDQQAASESSQGPASSDANP